MDSKKCTKCGMQKSLDEFYYHKRNSRIQYQDFQCKECQTISNRCWRKANPEEVVKEAIQVATLALKIAEMFDAEI